jgi:hypothetical protein
MGFFFNAASMPGEKVTEYSSGFLPEKHELEFVFPERT